MDLIVTVEEPFLPYISAATSRLRYIFPAWEFGISGNQISIRIVSGAEVDLARRETMFALYREKVFAETLPLRDALYRTLLA